MMKKVVIFIFVNVLFFSCSQQPDFQAVMDDIEQETNIHFLAQDAEYVPAEELLSEKSMDELSTFYQKQLTRLDEFKTEELTTYEQTAMENMQRLLQQKIKIYTEETHTNPNVFAIVKLVETYAKYPDSTPDEQFESIVKKLGEIPSYFEKAKTILNNPTEDQLKIAVERYSNDFFFLKNELPTLLRKPDILKEDQIDFSQKNEKAQLAVKDFVAFLNSHSFEIQDAKMQNSEN